MKNTIKRDKNLVENTRFSHWVGMSPPRRTDYSPFGVLLPERTSSTAFYRLGFQGQEHDDEVSGSGNHYTAQYWEYDPRLGKRWNTDPVVKHHESPYACFANNPIWFIDTNGADTINGNKALPAIKDLKKWSAQIEENRKNIEEMIQNRDHIYKQIGDIETVHDYSELLNSINPFKANPWHKAVDKHVKLNDGALKALKVSFVVMELVINAEISNHNKDVENYNLSLAELHFGFKTMDNDDNLYMSNEVGTVFMKQNKTSQMAALRVTIDGDIYRFGFIKKINKRWLKH